MGELVNACEFANPFRPTNGATLYSDVLLPNISEPLSQRFDAWVREVCVPIITECLGVTLTFYQGPSRLRRLFTALGIVNTMYDTPSRIERLLHLRGLQHRLLGSKLLSSPLTFMTKYAEDTQPSTGLHADALAGATLVLNLNDGFEGGGGPISNATARWSPPRKAQGSSSADALRSIGASTSCEGRAISPRRGFTSSDLSVV